jgi:hypothetical protein
MTPYQEPKYKIEDGRIVNRQSGESIPDDEPIMIFRARDFYAPQAILAYLTYIDGEHRGVVSVRYLQFLNWQKEHKDRVKMPDTQKDSGWTEAGSPQ